MYPNDDYDLGGTSEIVFDGPIDGINGSMVPESDQYQYAGMSTYAGGPEQDLGTFYGGQPMGNGQFYGGQPEAMIQAPEIYMLRSKILELSRSLAMEIESHKQTESKTSEYITQLKKSSRILEGSPILKSLKRPRDKQK